MEDVLCLQAMMKHVKVEEQSEVALVVNTNPYRHHSQPILLSTACHIHQYAPTVRQMARVDFNIVHSILIMYNTVWQYFDKILFEDASDTSIATLTLINPIGFVYCDPAQFDTFQYLLAGIFLRDLNFPPPVKSVCKVAVHIMFITTRPVAQNLLSRRKSFQVSKKERD